MQSYLHVKGEWFCFELETYNDHVVLSLGIKLVVLVLVYLCLGAVGQKVADIVDIIFVFVQIRLTPARNRKALGSSISQRVEYLVGGDRCRIILALLHAMEK